jgi:glycine dehydrogenase subunit 1
MSAHPWMANSTAVAKQSMLEAIGASSIDELFAQIPADHRLSRPLELEPALVSETALQRHLLELVSRNGDCEANLSFLGAGCWQHHVPAVCDEIATRSEFTTSVFGTAQSDKGRNQAWFEFTSQVAELVDLDFVGLPVYTWGAAGGHAIRMAARLTGRSEVLYPASLDPERLAVFRTFCEPPEMPGHIALHEVAVGDDGRVDVADLRSKLSDRTAAVYLDNPSFLGVIETAGAEIASLAHDAGAEFIVGVDPISLGVLAPPGGYGADFVVGSLQPLGIHLHAGGGTGGFIATRDEERYARQYPTLCLSAYPTSEPGELGFGIALFEQTSYGSREEARDWTGNSVYLWSTVAASYLALMGPAGMREVGEACLARSHAAARRLAQLPGVEVVYPDGFFKEFVVRFDGTGRTVAEINRALLDHGIFGGKDLSADFAWLGQSALYCVTEVHTSDDVERLATALAEVTR